MKNKEREVSKTKPPLSFPSKFVLWFIGTVHNDVEHPVYGKHQLTLHQLKYAPVKYKDDLYTCMAKTYTEDKDFREKYRNFK